MKQFYQNQSHCRSLYDFLIYLHRAKHATTFLSMPLFCLLNTSLRVRSVTSCILCRKTYRIITLLATCCQIALEKTQRYVWSLRNNNNIFDELNGFMIHSRSIRQQNFTFQITTLLQQNILIHNIHFYINIYSNHIAFQKYLLYFRFSWIYSLFI